MQSRKSKLFNLLFLVLVFALTLYYVLHGEDLNLILDTLTSADPFWLLCGAGCVLFFIYGESSILHYLFRTLKISTGRTACFLYSGVGFFFSCITPSASGGQPAQVYYMRRDQIPVPVATVVLLVVTITYKSVLVLIGIYLLLFQQTYMQHYLVEVMPVFYLGMILNIICCAVMLVLVFHTTLADRIVKKCLDLAVRIGKGRYKERLGRLRHRLTFTMEHYASAAAYLKQNKKVLARVLAVTFLQRTALFLTTYFVYRAFGLSEKTWFEIVILQASISIAVDMLPLPGGMGISEHLFLCIFGAVFYGDYLIPGMILSRGLAYYIQMLLGGCLTAAVQIRGGKVTKGE